MEFFCVFSVGGSLASYQVKQVDETTFIASLKSGSNRYNGIPPEITFRKNGESWQAQPHHEEIFTALVHAIETSSR